MARNKGVRKQIVVPIENIYKETENKLKVNGMKICSCGRKKGWDNLYNERTKKRVIMGRKIFIVSSTTWQ